MVLTANEQFLDWMIAHQIGLMRVAMGLSKEIQNKLEANSNQLINLIENHVHFRLITKADWQKLTALLEDIAELRSQVWSDIYDFLLDNGKALSSDEKQQFSMAFALLMPVVVKMKSSGEQVPIGNTFVQGRPLKDWVNRMRDDDIGRIGATLQSQLLSGADEKAIATSIRGTKRMRYKDGISQGNESAIETVTRTFVNTIANVATNAIVAANEGLFSKEVYVAVLDGRTSANCRSLDGQVFSKGKGPHPPIHPNCRSRRFPVADIDKMVRLPTVHNVEKVLLKEYAQIANIPTASSAGRLSGIHKSAFDAYSEKRKRELVGQVPGKTTYQEWLSRQTAAVQDDILGPTRGKLFRKGGLTLDRFVARDGSQLNLDELRKREESAFRKAGLL